MCMCYTRVIIEFANILRSYCITLTVCLNIISVQYSKYVTVDVTIYLRNNDWRGYFFYWSVEKIAGFDVFRGLTNLRVAFYFIAYFRTLLRGFFF